MNQDERIPIADPAAEYRELQTAILRVKLRHLDTLRSAKRDALRESLDEAVCSCL